MPERISISWIVVFCCSLVPGTVSRAQTYNVPPATAPNSIGPTATLNLGEGGTLPDAFEAGGTLNIAGGSIGDWLKVDGGTVTVKGNEFRIDGVPINVSGTINYTIPFGGLLSGTLSSGTPFAFYSFGYAGVGMVEDYFRDGAIRLQSASLPAIGPAVINVTDTNAPHGIRTGQTLNLQPGGVLPANFNAGRGSAVNVLGGSTGSNFEAVANTVSISGGSVGDFFDAFGGTVNISAGNVGQFLEAFKDSVVTISGGSVGDYVRVYDNSTVNISGGTVGAHFAGYGGQINITGGNIGEDLNVNDQYGPNPTTINFTISGGAFGDGAHAFLWTGESTVVGDQFLLDGQPVAGLQNVGDTVSINMLEKTLSGTLADGTPFVFTAYDADQFTSHLGMGLTLRKAALPAVAPDAVVGPGSPAPLGARVGQHVTVDGGALADNFNAGQGSTVTINNGTVGGNLEAMGASVTIAGGSVGDGLDAFPGSTVQISGGSVGNSVTVYHDSVVTITGGTVGNQLRANAGGTINIGGGVVGEDFYAFEGTVVNVSGGQIGNRFQAYWGSRMNISGGSFGSFSAAGLTNPSQITIVNMTGGSLGYQTSFNGVQFNMSGGSIADYASFNGNNLINLSGGFIGRGATFGLTELNMSGGRFGDGILFYDGIQFSLIGGEFRLNGALIAGLDNIGDSTQLVVPSGGTLTATLADGTPIILFNSRDADPAESGQDYFPTHAITLRRAALAPEGPQTVIVSSPSDAGSVRGGHTMIVTPGGALGESFVAGYGSTLRVNGGTVGRDLEIADATLELTAGSIDEDLRSFGNSHVTISGGAVGDFFTAFGTSTVDISGGTIDYGLQAVDNSTLNISGGEISVLYASMASHVNFSGGSVFNFGAVEGSAVFNMSGGSIARDFQARQGSTVNLSGGNIGYRYDMQSGSLTNLLAGGSIDESATVSPAATLNVHGGTIGNSLTAQSGGHIELYGGEFRLNGVLVTGLANDGDTRQLDLPAGSILSGTLADGTPVAFFGQYVPATSLPSTATDNVANGTLTLHKAALPAITQTVINVPAQNAPQGVRGGQTLRLTTGGTLPDQFNAGLGSTVQIAGGNVGRNFEAIGASVTVSGGTVGDYFEAANGSIVNVSAGSILNAGSAHHGTQLTLTGGTIGGDFEAFESAQINVLGGSLGNRLRAYSNSVVTVAGGSVGGSFDVRTGATANLLAGSIGTSFDVFTGSTFNMAGGSLANGITANSGSKMNIGGGIVGDIFRAMSTSEVNLFGTDFRINGTPIANLVLGQKFTVTTRNATLSGHFVDGSAFSFDLTSTLQSNQDFFSTSATLTVTLLVATVPGDFSRNGIVDAADYVLWRRSFGQTVAKGTNADGNFNGLIDESDYWLWRINFGRSASGAGAADAVPEPRTMMLMFFVGLVAVCKRRVFVS